ncbi:MAG: TetR/AcrR family transcriptional regulator [Conexibacter sp.]|nr:TetR/AcrR family transcriptional regulator [Conexibacter sp.]
MPPGTRPRSNGRKSGGAAKAGGQTRPRDAEVIKTAAQVFARRGYAAATVQDVADELGILKGSIYYYIKTKEDLLYRVLLQVHEEVDVLLEEVKQAEVADPIERLVLYVRTQATYNLSNLVAISVYYNDIDQLGDERRREILRRRKVHEDYVIGLVLDGQRAALIDADRDARLLTYNIFATLIWPYRWYRPRSRVKVDDVVDSCVAFVRGGLARR